MAWKMLSLVLISLLTLSCASKVQGQSNLLTYQILEELSPGTFLGNLAIDSRLVDQYNMTVLRQLRFSFLSNPPGIDEDLFKVNGSGGTLNTLKKLDRDSICPGQEECVLMYDFAIQPQQYFQLIKVQIEILDINDNAPVFPQKVITHQILESTLPGKSFSVPAATDIDSPKYSVQQYELNSKNKNKFQLKVREMADGAIDLRLLLAEQLDREELDHYVITIIAKDGGKPAKSGSITIQIQVLDANDNNPKFENSSYEVNVLENIPISTTVVRVKARDPDFGQNGQIVYSFSRHTEQTYGATFGIYPSTGEIYTKKNLDYETTNIYLLSVMAKDRGPDSLPAQANIVVRVKDINDNAPEITVNTLTTTGDAHVTENTPPGTFVAHISVEDKDNDKNGVITCSLNSFHFHLEKLYMTEYKIVTASTFDRERHPYFDLRLQCRDAGKPQLSSYADIRINIVDENDHRPEFSQSTYSTTLTENNHIDDFIISVTARDRDEGENGWVRFKLHDDAKNLVAINEETGWITANVVFDHEDIDELKFHVLAADLGNNAQTATALVTITILDIDDEKPIFVEERYAFGTFENQPAGTEVGQVVANDRDGKPYNTFQYSLDARRSRVDSFTVDPFSGTIKTKRVLDREEYAVYYLCVIASGDNPSKSSSASVSIYVADQNDNAPSFVFPTMKNNTVAVSNQAPTGHEIGQVRAEDKDTGKNARLRYVVRDGNEDDYFRVDPSSGSVTINRDLTHLTKKKFLFNIQVEDQGDPALSDLSQLVIEVNNALGYQRASSQGSISQENLIILIVFAAATFVISSIIIATIVFIRRKDRQREVVATKKEMQRMLPPSQTPKSSHQMPPPPPAVGSISSSANHTLPKDHTYIMAAGGCGSSSSSSIPQTKLSNCDSNHYLDNQATTLDSRPNGTAWKYRNASPRPPSTQASYQTHGHAPKEQLGGNVGQSDESDRSSSGLSCSDSGRGPSSEEEDQHRTLLNKAALLTQQQHVSSGSGSDRCSILGVDADLVRTDENPDDKRRTVIFKPTCRTPDGSEAKASPGQTAPKSHDLKLPKTGPPVAAKPGASPRSRNPGNTLSMRQFHPTNLLRENDIILEDPRSTMSSPDSAVHSMPSHHNVPMHHKPYMSQYGSLPRSGLRSRSPSYPANDTVSMYATLRGGRHADGIEKLARNNKTLIQPTGDSFSTFKQTVPQDRTTSV